MAVRFIVEGRVQGVFYRASTQETAAALGLAGWARNLSDGRVEVVASGDPAAVESLAAWLWDGPPGAVVTGVMLEEWPSDVRPGFTVES
jgi:acylphosphatase